MRQVAEAESGSTEVVVVDVPVVDLTSGAGGVEYVVQRLEGGAGCATWTDIARVVAPPRSKRATIIRAGAGRVAMAADALSVPLVVRVLDAEAAREHVVSLRERAPELVIG